MTIKSDIATHLKNELLKEFGEAVEVKTKIIKGNVYMWVRVSRNEKGVMNHPFILENEFPIRDLNTAKIINHIRKHLNRTEK